MKTASADELVDERWNRKTHSLNVTRAQNTKVMNVAAVFLFACAMFLEPQLYLQLVPRPSVPPLWKLEDCRVHNCPPRPRVDGHLRQRKAGQSYQRSKTVVYTTDFVNGSRLPA